jgi:hypothetical protein
MRTDKIIEIERSADPAQAGMLAMKESSSLFSG